MRIRSCSIREDWGVEALDSPGKKQGLSENLKHCKAFSRHAVVGDPPQIILDFIQKESIDMVVMCRKGEGSHFNMGGVAQKVVSNSPVPVVITQYKQGE